MTPPTSKTRVPLGDVIWLLVLGIVWGSSFAAIKVSVATMPPMTLVAVRVVIAAAVLATVMIIKGGRLPRDATSWKMGFALGTIGLGLPFFLIGWGEERVDSSLAAILMAVMPLSTILLAHVFTTGDRLTGRKMIGIAIGFAGVLILVGPEAMRGLGGDIWHQLAVAGGAVCYAVNAVMTRNLPQIDAGGAPGTQMMGRATMVMICGAVIAVPLAALVDGPLAAQGASHNAWLSALYLGVLPTGLATLVYFHLIEAQGASFFSFVNYLNPVFGVIWGALLLSEVISLQALAALGAILLGIAIANWRWRSS